MCIITKNSAIPHPLLRAVEIASLGPSWGPNPRVGCVIARGETILAEGYHRGAGTPHAEVDALEAARHADIDVSGATAYVTLEPCRHFGKTPPCTDALIAAKIGAVVYAVADPNPEAGGGAQVLVTAGINAVHLPVEAAESLNARWLRSIELGRPYVIAKWAATLDGRVAAADGSSFWVTGQEARDHAHGTRAQVDAIVVGTGTVLTDDPLLSARPPGVEAPHQPLRVVMGMTDTSHAQVWRDANALAVRSHDPHEAIAALAARDARTVLVEGGSVVLSAFFQQGLVDEIHAYIAPAILGSGPLAVDDVGITSMEQALRGQDVTVTTMGVDTLITAIMSKGS